MAKEFLKRNQHILQSTKEEKKKLTRSSKVPEIIDLVNETTASKSCLTKTMDLTDTKPELIVLDDTVNELNQTISKLNKSLCSIDDLDIIDLSNNIFCSQRKRTSSGCKVQIVKIDKSNNKNPISPNDDLTIHINKSGLRSVKKNQNQTPLKRSSSLSHLNGLSKLKERKLLDSSNIPSSSTSSKHPLADLGYVRKQRHRTDNDNELLKKQPSVKINQKSIRTTVNKTINKKLTIGARIRYQRDQTQETNIFNPNPHDVDVVGLRPVAIDGSNIAVCHGRGSFSVKGIQICVDYFAKRGHKNVKVFLPLHREKYFTTEELAELKTKCDIVFTPSQVINGNLMTSYDDRFTIQYADEFGAVVVSTDNYRDLLKENPKWQKTIETRLLMFTFVDDFLMFPMDPLGPQGPTLDEYLRF